MKFFIFILLLSLIITGCVQKNKAPRTILAQEEMTSVIWDLIRADEFVYNYVMKDSSLDKRQESVKLYEQVFSIHGTSKEQFEKSLTFYQNHPNLLKPVIDSFKRYESRVMQSQTQPQTIPDSIRSKMKIKRP